MKEGNEENFFEKLYLRSSDPWDFNSSHYELERYNQIFNTIDNKKFTRIFEPGCSIGVLTLKLVSIADQVDAIDISPTAVKLAMQRCAELKNVTFSCQSIQDYLIHPDTDLIILSEIGYYFTEQKLSEMITNFTKKINGPFQLLASHWLGESSDHILTGHKVQDVIGSNHKLSLEQQLTNDNFRLGLWSIK